ncbi:MAG: hypothetical protein LBU91_02210 [Bacteroidales bacterium]|jgi:membrane-bound ClpP family serine protease|nr:hypothetical protein [Bacteroidales bacterium]
MELVYWILLIVLGFGLLLFELFIVPGTSVIGLVGFGAAGYGVYRIFTDLGTVEGWIALVSVLVLAVGLVYWFLKTKSWKKIMLDDKLDSKVNVIDEQKIKVGDEGKSLSRLAPTGQAMFSDELFEVQSMDGFIDPKTPIKVVKIENSKIFVVGA